MTKRSEEKGAKKRKILELYNDNISQKEIAERVGCSQSLVSIYIKELDLETHQDKNKRILSKEYLDDEYILKNRSVKDIGKELGISPATVLSYVKKYELYKMPSDIQRARISKRKKTMIEKYGEEHPMHVESIRDKVYSTNLKRYGFPNPFQSEQIQKKFQNTMLERYGSRFALSNDLILEKVRSSKLENGNILMTDLGTVSELSQKYNISEAAIRKILSIKEYDKKSLEDALISYSNKTYLEIFFEENTGEEFFNRKNEIGYRPDFKIKDDVYVNVDGLYWHSDFFLDKKYHFDMRVQYENANKRIIQFRADEVFYKTEIMISMINNLKGNNKKVGARKVLLKNVDQKTANEFYNKNHLMGSTKAKHIGLFNKDVLIMMVSYKKYGDVLKIERMATKCGFTVQGGFGKLLKHLKVNNEFKEIHYWVDLRYGTGNFLSNFSFKKERDVLGWKWTDFKNTYNRLRCKANMDDRNLSQAEHAVELGWVKIYDAGQRLWVLK